MLKDHKVDNKIKRKLILVKKVLKFAKEFQLNTAGSYINYIDNGTKPVSYLLQAAYKNKLELYTWWFPVVGSVPYIGFIDEIDRKQELQDPFYKAMDIKLSNVSAFSSLGWYSDPIYRSMLKNSDIILAQIILHELVHRTLWISGEVKYNEALAEFVSYLILGYYIEEVKPTFNTNDLNILLRDRSLFRTWLKEFKQELEVLYLSKLPLKKVEYKKQNIINKYVKIKKVKFTRYEFIKGVEWNNATILSRWMYIGDEDVFKKAYGCTKGSSPKLRLKNYFANIRKLIKLKKSSEKFSNVFKNYCIKKFL